LPFFPEGIPPATGIHLYCQFFAVQKLFHIIPPVEFL
jgi:hypothetical protein